MNSKFEYASVRFQKPEKDGFTLDTVLTELSKEGWDMSGVCGEWVIVKRPVVKEKEKKEVSLITSDVMGNFFESLLTMPGLAELGKRFPTVPSEYLAKESVKFYSYWTEQNSKGKQRWQMEKVFDPYRRMATWISRSAPTQISNSNPRGKGTIA